MRHHGLLYFLAIRRENAVGDHTKVALTLIHVPNLAYGLQFPRCFLCQARARIDLITRSPVTSSRYQIQERIGKRMLLCVLVLRLWAKIDLPVELFKLLAPESLSFEFRAALLHYHVELLLIRGLEHR